MDMIVYSYTIHSMSSVDTVQDALMGALLRGELAPGTWLRQDEIAEQHGVSKVPVREALQRLAGIGLLRFVPNRGAVVPELSAAEAEEHYALRRGVEPQLLRRAVPRLSIVDLAEAELALSDENRGDPKRSGRERSLTEANWAFHRALYRAAGWQRGLALVEILHVAVAPYVLLYTEGLGGAGDSHAEHHALLAACRDGDVEASVGFLGDHLDHAEAALVDWLGRAPGETG